MIKNLLGKERYYFNNLLHESLAPNFLFLHKLNLVHQFNCTSIDLLFTSKSNQVHHSIRITKLIIIPTDQLKESTVQLHTSIGVKSTASRISIEISTDHTLFSITQYTFHFTIGSIFNCLFDLCV